MKLFLALLSTLLFSLPSFGSKVFNFETPLWTAAPVGRIGQTVLFDVLSEKTEQVGESKNYASMLVSRLAFQCKKESILSIANKTVSGFDKFDVSFATGAPIDLSDHTMDLGKFKTTFHLTDQTSLKVIASAKKFCKSTQSQYLHELPIGRNKVKQKYGDGKVFSLIPNRIRLSGDIREFWLNVYDISIDPIISHETAKEIGIPTSNLGENVTLKGKRTIMKQRVRCSKMDSAVITATEFNDDGSVGARSPTIEPAESDFREASPGSIGESLIEFVCAL